MVNMDRRGSRSGWLSVAASGLALCFALAPGAALDRASASSPSLVGAAGTMEVEANPGVSGLAIQLDAPAVLRRSGVTASYAGVAGFVRLAKPSVAGETCGFCPVFDALLEPNGGTALRWFGPDALQLQPGTYELYFALLEPAVLSLRFEGLEGAVEAFAGGRVRGAALLLPSECPPAHACGALRHGGYTYSVGEALPAVAYLRTLSYFDRGDATTVENAGNYSVVGCIYGEAWGTSSRSEDHPMGCDLWPDAKDPVGPSAESAVRTLSRHAGQVPCVPCASTEEWFAAPRGETYLGFSTLAAAAAPGWTGAFGAWLERGIEPA